MKGLKFPWPLWSILTTHAESSTVYSVKVEVFKKWKMGFLSIVENLVPPSQSITFFIISTPNLSHLFVFSLLQYLQSPHSPLKIGTTKSPSFISLTPSPTLSTILQIHQYNHNHHNFQFIFMSTMFYTLT